MLKLRIILISAFVLLLVGLDMNVRAAVSSKKIHSKSTEKDDSKKESNEQEPREIITHLDFFGAFSLVNVQLQWRDLNSILNTESKAAKSSFDPDARSFRGFKKFSLDGNGQIAATVSSTRQEVIPVRIFRVIDGNTHFIYTQNKQSRSTIAYIQNCSIDPYQC